MAQAWLARLPAEERARFDGYRVESARIQYLATRALVRTVLSLYSGAPVESLRFTASPSGRPELTTPALPALRFSLSNTRGLVVGLVAAEREVGVDVEEIAPVDVFELADRFFAPTESRELRATAEPERLRRFLEMWTLKEAYLKARGMGVFDVALAQISFRRRTTGALSPVFGPDIADDPGSWQLDLQRLSATHVAASCIGRGRPGNRAESAKRAARIVVRRLGAEDIA